MSRSKNSVAKGGTAAIMWQPWGEAAFALSAASGRPVLLSLTAFWCAQSRHMDAVAFADRAVVRLVEDEFVPVRVDADREPHIGDRYNAGDLPTTAFLTPTGEVLWAGTGLGAADLLQVAASVLAAWRERREELEQEIGRRTWALEAARGRNGPAGLVRREPAEEVLAVAQREFDETNGGFGTAPKSVSPDLIELLYAHAAAGDAARMADQTLDGALSGELWDTTNGGFFRCAMSPDWTRPRREKLLDGNAAMLYAYALGARLRDREDWRTVAERTVAWADATLATSSGLWGGSEAAAVGGAHDAAVGGAPDAATPAQRPPVDATLFAAANARWIGALALSGAWLERPEWVARADTAMRRLLDLFSAPDGGLFHYLPPGGAPRNDLLLIDVLEGARAALHLAQATGEWEWTHVARRFAAHMESAYWAEEGGFHERIRSPADVGALRYLDCQFDANSAAARLLLDLAQVTGERHWRALAERTLASLAPRAGRFGPDAAAFALATEEFFDAPPAVFIALPRSAGEAAPLRSQALVLPVPALRVWSVPAGHRSGPEHFAADDAPLAYVVTRRGRSAALAAPAQLAAAGSGIR